VSGASALFDALFAPRVSRARFAIARHGVQDAPECSPAPHGRTCLTFDLTSPAQRSRSRSRRLPALSLPRTGSLRSEYEGVPWISARHSALHGRAFPDG